jgi:uncharacterized Fe-S cluster protein YjdI
MKVSWDQQKCSHSGRCVRELPEVFKVENGSFVIDANAATPDRIRQQVERCPSKALAIEGGHEQK